MKHRFIKSFFAFLSVFVVLVSSLVPVLASDTPVLYSGAYSDDGYIFTGNTDVLITYSVYSSDLDDYIQFSTSLNPSVSSNMVEYSSVVTSVDTVSPFPATLDSVELVSEFYNFESTPDYFISGLVTDRSWFASDFYVHTFSDSNNYFVESLRVTVRDFYIYLNPNGDYFDDYYLDYYAESFIKLYGNPIFDGADGTIFYCLAGEEDNANNRLVYNYSLTAEEIGSPDSLFHTLPSDQSFDGLYSEPTLIYVEFFELIIPLDQLVYYELNDFLIDGHYVNYNLDYRNIDITSHVEPTFPVNPGIYRDYTGWIGTAVGGFLDLEIVDGFSLGGVLMVLIAFLLTMWFLKVFAGG